MSQFQDLVLFCWKKKMHHITNLTIYTLPLPNHYQKLQSNDGVLALHLSKVLGLSYEKSVIEIHKQVINWNEKLKIGKLNLYKIGELSLNDEGAILFNPKKKH